MNDKKKKTDQDLKFNIRCEKKRCISVTYIQYVSSSLDKNDTSF